MTTPRLPSARRFAVAAHGDQKYGALPYACHLDAVAALAAPFGTEAVNVAYLHDVLEDTATAADQLAGTFGDAVARSVGLVTDAPGPNRKTRKSMTYARLAATGAEGDTARIVKAADRLANVRACATSGAANLWRMYRLEHDVFRVGAYRPGLSDSLWDELDGLLASEWPTERPLTGPGLIDVEAFVQHRLTAGVAATGAGPRLELVCGGVAAGKSTYRAAHLSDCTQVDASDLFELLTWNDRRVSFPGPVEDALNDIGQDLAGRAFAQRGNVAVELVGEQEATMSALIDKARACGYHVKVTMLTCPVEEAVKRNAARGSHVSAYFAGAVHLSWLIDAASQL